VNNLKDSALQQYLRLHARNDSFNQMVEKGGIFVEALELTATPSKSKLAVRFAETLESNSENVTKDKVLEGLEEVLRAVLQNSGSQGAPSSNSGHTSPQNQSSQNSQANSGSGNNPRNRYFSPNRGNNVSNSGNARNASFSPLRNGSNRNQNWNSPSRGYNNNRQNSNNSGQSFSQRGPGNFCPNTQNNQSVPNAGNAGQASQQQNSNQNGPRNQRQSRCSVRPRTGCFVCDEIGCHSWFHEQNRNCLPAETGRNQNSSQPPGNVPRRSNASSARCPVCFNFYCPDPNACVNVLRRSQNLCTCPCWCDDCPGPDSCEWDPPQSDADITASQPAGDNQSIPPNPPNSSNSSNNPPNVDWTMVRGNRSRSSFTRSPRN